MVKVIVDVGLGGNSEVRVEGCPGPNCKSLTSAIEKALGSTVSDQRTADYHKQPQVGQQAQAGSK
jgi:hypothetical protein